MSLTPTEEAQTRQLLDQLAALLSLATSEPTIISKLAASKVSLSDLSSVVTVNDTDLLLSRQGTDDKSVTVEKLKDFVKDSVSTVAFNDGTAASPSITNDGDLDTGFYFPAANTIGVTAAGVERLRFTTTGVGVNVATPTYSFDIVDAIPAGAENGFTFKEITDTTRGINFVRTSGSYSYNGITGSVGQLYSSTSLSLMADSIGGNNSILFSVGGAIRAQLQWDGKFGIGTTTPATTLDVNGDVTITDKIIHSGDTDTSIRFPAVDTVTVETSGVERLRVTSGGNVGIGTTPSEQLHITGNFRIGSAVQATPSGSAPLYAARAWVNFNGTGTVAIRASGNVTSITDNSTGNYTVNFTTAMPDENYSVIATGTYQTGQEVGASVGVFSNVPPTTTAARLVFHINTGLPVDNAYANVAIFR
jgi:hypothetical protein